MRSTKDSCQRTLTRCSPSPASDAIRRVRLLHSPMDSHVPPWTATSYASPHALPRIPSTLQRTHRSAHLRRHLPPPIRAGVTQGFSTRHLWISVRPSVCRTVRRSAMCAPLHASASLMIAARSRTIPSRLRSRRAAKNGAPSSSSPAATVSPYEKDPRVDSSQVFGNIRISKEN